MDPFVEDWRRALELRAALRDGYRPQPFAGPGLGAAEPVFAQESALVEQLVGVQLALGGTAPGKHASAAHWAPIAHGTACLTPFRVAVRGQGELSFGWTGLSALFAEGDGIHLQYASGAADQATHFRLRTASPVWWTMMISIVGFGHEYPANPPDWVVRQLGW